MASTPPNANLPLFFNELQPLSSVDHADWKLRRQELAPFLVKNHAVPITIEEFAVVQRYYPIIFSVGENPVPLALMGLNEDVNTFVDDEGRWNSDAYTPAYIRRYPFLLARLRENSDELSLCFDPTSDAIGAGEEGEALFVDGKPSEATQAILQFCEQFEQAGQRTGAFMDELVKSGLLMDGEVQIQPDATEQPFVYRGFQMVNEEKLADLRGDALRKMNKNGMLPLIYAHLFSLSLMRDIFARQVQQGKTELPQAASA